MRYKMIRSTCETVYNNYELIIDKVFCTEMKNCFADCEYPIFTDITPDYIKWVMEDGCHASTMQSLSQAEQDFVQRIYDYIEYAIWEADFYTNDNNIDSYNDEFEEIDNQ